MIQIIYFGVLLIVILRCVICGMYMFNKVVDAICDLHIDMIRHDEYYNYPVTYDDIRPLVVTIFMIWNWGYTSVIPKDKLRILRPYMKKKR
jgi:hypothetical protein